MGTRGSRLRLRHQLPPPVLVFGFIWLSFAGMIALSVGSSWFSAGGRFDPISLIPVGMLVFGVLVFVLPFWYEVGKSRPLLVQLLRLEAAPAA